jgi:hypothetical protein
MSDQRSLRIAGAAFGVWLSVLYAVFADQINRIFLPGIPLADPAGGTFGYYLGAIAAGLLVGLACTWFDNSWLGALVGGVVGALLVYVAPWSQAMGSADRTMGTVILTLTTFFPLTLILAPVSLLIRFAVNNLPTRIEGALSPRRIGLPLLVTGMAILFGAWALFPQEVRDAMYTTQQMIREAMKVSTQDELPENMREIVGFKPNASGSYTLEWNQNTALFMGPHPVTSRMNSDFLIVARFKNGFKLACIFAPGVKNIPCANFQ